jgi:hypothetical protein
MTLDHPAIRRVSGGAARQMPRWNAPASVAELADAPGLGPGVRKDVGVRVPSLAPTRDSRPARGCQRGRNGKNRCARHGFLPSGLQQRDVSPVRTKTTIIHRPRGAARGRVRAGFSSGGGGQARQRAGEIGPQGRRRCALQGRGIVEAPPRSSTPARRLARRRAAQSRGARLTDARTRNRPRRAGSCRWWPVTRWRHARPLRPPAGSAGRSPAAGGRRPPRPGPPARGPASPPA